MKKLITMFAGVAFLVGTSSFAGPGDSAVSSKTDNPVVVAKAKPEAVNVEFNAVKNAFDNHFDAQSVIRWKVTDEFYFVYFVAEKHCMFAAFNKDAELLAVSRNISKSDLPLNVTESLRKSYSNCQIEENVLEMSLQGETSYYITAKGSLRTYQLKSNASGDLSVVSKTKKKRLVGSIGF